MKEKFELLIPEKEKIEEEVIKEIKAVTDDEKNQLDNLVEEKIEQILNIDINNENDKQDIVSAIENLGIDLQKESAKKSTILQEPLKTLSKRGDEGSEVSSALLKLREEVEALDPSGVDFNRKNFLSKLFNPVEKYFDKYQSAQSSINEIIKSLENGSDILKRDNITLTQDQIDMRELTKKLEKTIVMSELLDEKISTQIELEEDPRKIKFLRDEVLFPLRQRIMDLQQQLAVNQQGVLALEVLKRNNKELIRGVNRSKLVTINALKVAVVVAKGLSDQKLVLDQIEAVNDTTNSLIANTSKNLKTQGVAIQKQASSAMLNVDTLKESFKNINEAMDEISKYRQESLPMMRGLIDEFDDLTRKSEERIQQMEKGNKVKLN